MVLHSYTLWSESKNKTFKLSIRVFRFILKVYNFPKAEKKTVQVHGGGFTKSHVLILNKIDVANILTLSGNWRKQQHALLLSGVDHFGHSFTHARARAQTHTHHRRSYE